VNGTESLRRDAADRERALAPRSFIVEAPAGAGKTELLTQRLLMLLARVEAPEEIVAITFTRKAAAEMRGRILESLELALAGEAPAAAHKRLTVDLARRVLEVSRQRGWALAENPGRLRITTIDAFCAGLARQLPLLSRFGGEPRVVDKAERHYEEAARRTLDLLADDAPGGLGDLVAAALAHLDNDVEQLGRLLVRMLGRRDQWLGYAVNHPPVEAAREALAALVAADLARVAVPAALQAPLRAAGGYAAGQVDAGSPIAALRDWQTPLGGALEDLPRWRGLAELLLTRDGSPRKQFTKREGLPAGKDSEPFKAALKSALEAFPAADALARVRRIPDPDLPVDDWATVTALAGLLKVAAAQLWQVFREAGEVDFIEVAQRALAALGEPGAPTDLALALDYRIRHLLVDEFQDTNRAQVDLLARLTAGWTPDDGRTLFLVGDPMQSIYRFRKADVGLFLEVLAQGIGGLRPERLSLCRNNRSSEAVVEWVNGAFAQVFPGADARQAGAVAYRAFTASREPLADAGVRVHPLVGPKAAADAREARLILALVDATWAADPGRGIAVLVKARKHLAPLVAEIRRHRPRLTFSAVEIDALAGRQPVQDLLTLTRALQHRADRLHWLAILRAPWCGLTLADLHALAGDDHDSTIWTLIQDEARLARLSGDGRERLRHLRAVMAQAYAHQGRQRLRRWVEGTWLHLGGAACLASMADANDAEAFLDLLDRLEAAGRFSIDTLETELADLYAAPDAAADGRLQFMTIHKAKGLEFDTVIVPGLHRATRGDEAPLVLWEPVGLEGGREGLVAAPLRRGDREGATAYDYLRALERERAGHETERLLYVAATRAVRALHWIGAVEPGDELTPPAGSPLALLWPVVHRHFEAAGAVEAVPEDTVPPLPPPPLHRLVRPAGPAWSAGEMAPAVAAVAAADGDEGAGDPLDASVGTLVHAYLEMIAGDGLAAWPTGRVEALLPAMALWLSQQGHDAVAAQAGAERCLAALRTTLGSQAGRWILEARPEAEAELALVRADGGRLGTHIVDRTFVEDGVRWIIDYKTARAGADTAALEAHAEHYREQLQRYAALFRDEGRRLRLGVFYTASGRLVELEADTD
jgi:ATP-dependent exoDNAse (exonuclease V) beta subunit